MMDTSIYFIAPVFVLAGLVKGVTGLGLPTVAVALLTLTMPPLQAAALLIVPSALTNAWQLAAGPALYPLWRRLWPMLLAACAGIGAGGWLLPAAGAGAMMMLLGLALAAYGVLGLSGWRGRVPAHLERGAGPLAGLATGLLAGSTGVFVMPAAPYLQALSLDKDDLVQALGLTFTVSTLALALMLAARGAWQPGDAVRSLIALPPALAGMALGQWLRGRMPALLFRRCFFASLLALGVHQCLRAVTA